MKDYPNQDYNTLLVLYLLSISHMHIVIKHLIKKYLDDNTGVEELDMLPETPLLKTIFLRRLLLLLLGAEIINKKCY